MAGQSISRAQAELLSDNFLDGLGSNPSFTDLQPNESLTALIELAALIITNAQKNLQEGGNIGSGKLSDSIKVKDPVMRNQAITLDIEALYYYQFINSGVKGTKSGNSAEGFAFKYSFPSKKMVQAIAEWLEKAHKITVHLRRPHAISETEKKNSTLSDIDSAYMIAKSITQKGIKRSSFFDKALRLAQAYAKEELGKALKTDVINTLPKDLSDGDSNQK